MTLAEAARQIKQGTFAPVYVLYGTEEFLMEEFLAFAKSAMIDPAYADLNVSRHDCAETPLAVILEDAETLPFMAEHRLVLAENAYFLTGNRPPGKPEVNLEALAAYLEQPSPTTSLVFCVNAEKLDERKRVVKTLHQRAVVLPFQPLRDADLYAWVERRAKQRGAVIDRPQAMRLVERAGSDLRLLDREVEKLALYVGRGGRITDETVDLLASRTLEQDVFALVEQVVTGRLAEAFRTLYDCLKLGEEPLKLLALIARQVRIMLHVKQWTARGYTEKQVAGMLKLHPFAVKKAAEQSRHFDEQALRRLLALLAEEDYRIKTGQVDKQLALELFITRVAGEAGERRLAGSVRR